MVCISSCGTAGPSPLAEMKERLGLDNNKKLLDKDLTGKAKPEDISPLKEALKQQEPDALRRDALRRDALRRDDVTSAFQTLSSSAQATVLQAQSEVTTGVESVLAPPSGADRAKAGGKAERTGEASLRDGLLQTRPQEDPTEEDGSRPVGAIRDSLSKPQTTKEEAAQEAKADTTAQVVSQVASKETVEKFVRPSPEKLVSGGLSNPGFQSLLTQQIRLANNAYASPQGGASKDKGTAVSIAA